MLVEQLNKLHSQFSLGDQVKHVEVFSPCFLLGCAIIPTTLAPARPPPHQSLNFAAW